MTDHAAEVVLDVTVTVRVDTDDESREKVRRRVLLQVHTSQASEEDLAVAEVLLPHLK